MKIFPILGAVTFCLALNGCVLYPGQHMNLRASADNSNPDVAHFKVIPITPRQIAADQAATPAPSIPPALISYLPEPYRIGPGDSLYITVWDHPELTSPAGAQQQALANGRLVRPDGTLFYPYAGLLQAAGKTVEELRSELTRRLAKYVPSPQVDLTIISYGSQKVTLGGAFVSAAPQFITVTPLTLAQAIGTANVNTTQADLSNVVLSRDGHDYHLDMDALSGVPKGMQDIYLKGGDHVFLSYNDNHEVYVVGEVVQPQALRFKTSTLTLTQAIGRAGGLNQNTAKGKAVYVIRGVKNLQQEPSEIYQLDASSPDAFAMASQFPVRAGDVVFVGAAGVARWNRFVSQLLPFSTLLNNTSNARLTNEQTNQL